MKVIGRKASIMGKGTIKHQVGQSTMESGKQGNIMELEVSIGLMGRFTRESGRIVGRMEKASSQE